MQFRPGSIWQQNLSLHDFPIILKELKKNLSTYIAGNISQVHCEIIHVHKLTKFLCHNWTCFPVYASWWNTKKLSYVMAPLFSLKLVRYSNRVKKPHGTIHCELTVSRCRLTFMVTYFTYVKLYQSVAWCPRFWMFIYGWRLLNQCVSMTVTMPNGCVKFALSRLFDFI